MLRTGIDYLSFMALLGALFAISGGICLRGSLAGTPAGQHRVPGHRARCSASLIGTTGASALLIRPLLRANEQRFRTTHIVVFFIFIVANGGGLLTPLGDPPLFLGFLRGVPFTWTLRLAPAWALENGVCWRCSRSSTPSPFARERRGRPPRAARRVRRRCPERAPPARRPQLLWLLGIVAVVFVMGTYGARLFPSEHAALRRPDRWACSRSRRSPG